MYLSRGGIGGPEYTTNPYPGPSGAPHREVWRRVVHVESGEGRDATPDATAVPGNAKGPDLSIRPFRPWYTARDLNPEPAD